MQGNVQHNMATSYIYDKSVVVIVTTNQKSCDIYETFTEIRSRQL
jgi:hypothetical protein